MWNSPGWEKEHGLALRRTDLSKPSSKRTIQAHNQGVVDRVLATIRRYRMIEPGQRVAVAVSGGADSVALLHILLELASQLDTHLSVVHLNHLLRGEESRADAEFVRELAAGLGLAAHFGEVDVARRAAESGDNLEQAARRARYGFFENFLSSGGADRIALGHTRSEQAETVLFRFLRGAGTAGLAGIRPVTAAGFVRPLIDVERAEVEQYLRGRGIPWREDSSNQVRDFARNRIRHDLLPMLARDWNPSLAETLARTAEWAQAEEAWWEQEIAAVAGRLLMRKPGFVLLRVEDLQALPLAVARRVARRAVEIVKGDLRSIGFEHIEAILALAASTEGSGRRQIPGLDVYRSFNWLRLAPPDLDTLDNRNFRFPLSIPGTVEVPGSKELIQFELLEPGERGYNRDVAGLDWERVAGSLELRNWRPGDQYRPVGRHSPEKIKALFQQSRIPLWERRNWPVITCGEEIVWARLFGPAADYAAGPACRAVLVVREYPSGDNWIAG
jgi:tRNA(Ile)-lysidine synthase